MANRIMITPEELRSAAGTFDVKSAEINDTLKTLHDLVNSLESTWDGAAQDQFFVMYNELAKNLEQFPACLDGISKQLQAVAQTLEETDAALASQLKA